MKLKPKEPVELIGKEKLLLPKERVTALEVAAAGVTVDT